MHRSIALAAALTVLLATGCATSTPVTATTLEPKIRTKVQRGVIEPGFTPEMVYLALGKPTRPAEGLADATSSGTWVYQDFRGADRGLVRAGYRSKVVFDPAKKSDVVVTERLDPQAAQDLGARSLHVTFRDGRVVEIQRGTEI